MSLSVIAKFAPVLTSSRWADPAWTKRGRTLYWPNSLRLIPGRVTPVVINHDEGRVVGRVEKLFTLEWTDGGPWICARAVVDDPPSWLRKHHTAVSFGYASVHETEHDDGWSRVTSGLVRELSLLSPGTEPCEPRPGCCRFGRSRSRPPRARARCSTAGRSSVATSTRRSAFSDQAESDAPSCVCRARTQRDLSGDFAYAGRRLYRSRIPDPAWPRPCLARASSRTGTKRSGPMDSWISESARLRLDLPDLASVVRGVERRACHEGESTSGRMRVTRHAGSPRFFWGIS